MYPPLTQQGIRESRKRIVFSSLYWGVGPMEDYLIDEIDKNLQKNDELRVKVLMDAYRGTRLTREGSQYVNSYDMINRLKVRNINRDVDVGLFKNSPTSFLSNLLRFNQYNEILGVHHIKLAIFDDNLILTGANFEEQYFLNRKDRYWIINDCRHMCDYLEDLVLTMLTHCDKINHLDDTEHSLGEQTSFKDLATYHKQQLNLMHYLYDEQSKQPFVANKQYIEDRSAESPPLALASKNLTVRDSFLKDMKSKNLGTLVSGLQFESQMFSSIDRCRGEYVYFLPMLQNKALHIQQENLFLQALIDHLSAGQPIDRVFVSSAYFNFPYYLFDPLVRLDAKKFDFVTAAPEVLASHPGEQLLRGERTQSRHRALLPEDFQALLRPHPVFCRLLRELLALQQARLDLPQQA